MVIYVGFLFLRKFKIKFSHGEVVRHCGSTFDSLHVRRCF